MQQLVTAMNHSRHARGVHVRLLCALTFLFWSAVFRDDAFGGSAEMQQQEVHFAGQVLRIPLNLILEKAFTFTGTGEDRVVTEPKNRPIAANRITIGTGPYPGGQPFMGFHRQHLPNQILLTAVPPEYVKAKIVRYKQEVERALASRQPTSDHFVQMNPSTHAYVGGDNVNLSGDVLMISCNNGCLAETYYSDTVWLRYIFVSTRFGPSEWLGLHSRVLSVVTALGVR
jgi:hypothetical protein